MKKHAPTCRRGSAILLAVGLLVMLAMIGSVFALMSYMDRRDSDSVAAVAPIRGVALTGLQMAIRNRTDDLWFNGNGGGPYSAADTAAKCIDYPREPVAANEIEYDQALATTTPQLAPDATGALIYRWPHLTNLAGLPAAAVVNVRADNPALVDTDGYTWNGTGGDALPFDSGVIDRSGRKYYLAMRVVDASSLVNINLAFEPPRHLVLKEYNSSLALTGNWVTPPMNPTHICLDPLVDYSTGGQSLNIVSIRSTGYNSLGYDQWLGPWLLLDYYNNYGLRPLNMGLGTAATGAHTQYKPFDMTEMLGMLWGGTDPDVMTGTRLGNPSSGMGVNWPTNRRYLTTWSAERIYVPIRPGNRRPQTVRADLNQSDLPTLYTAFYNALPPNAPPYSNDAADRTIRYYTAAQLAINAIAFRTPGNDVPVAGLDLASGDVTLGGTGGTLLYGVKRWPYITELFLKKFKKDAITAVKQYSAIELYNPYSTPVALAGYVLKVDGADAPMTNWPASIAAYNRIVIRSDAANIPVDPLDHTKWPPVVATTIVEAPTLDVSKNVKLIRPRGGNGSGTVDVVVGSARLDLADPADGKAAYTTLQWDDTWANARWSLSQGQALARPDAAHDYTSNNEGGSGTRTATATNLGQPNSTDAGFALSASIQPCPVFVRNGPFLNVGDALRLFCVGPTYAANINDSKSLSDRLTVTADPVANLYVGRLPLDGAMPAGGYGGNIPAVPVGCMLTDFLMVNSPLTTGVDNNNDGAVGGPGDEICYGKININTAPQAVLRCVPGMLLPTPPNPGSRVPYILMTNADAVVNDVVAYRDQAQYSWQGQLSTNFTNRVGAAGYTGLSNLRLEGTGGTSGPGFASVGEIALVLRRKALTLDPNNVPQNVNNWSYFSFDSTLDNDLIGPGNPYRVAIDRDANNVPIATDDGFAAAGYGYASGLLNDLTKFHSYYEWASNHLTVRSDTYLVYITVLAGTVESCGTLTGANGNTFSDSNKTWNIPNQWQTVMAAFIDPSGASQFSTIISSDATSFTAAPGGLTGAPVAGWKYQILPVLHRFAAVLDRSNCRTAADRPRILAFTEIR